MKIIQTTPAFDNWFASLRDRSVKVRIQMRIDRAELGNFGDCLPVAGNQHKARTSRWR